MSLPPILRATPGEARTVADLIATAFADLPQVAWLVPNVGDRRPVMTGHAQIMVEHALAHGHVDLYDDQSGAAVWLDRTQPLPAPYRYDDRLFAVCGSYTSRFQRLDCLFDAHHPQPPHHHLAFFAVRPGRQRHGLGTALLRHHHRHLDRTGRPAYLEASTDASRHLYARHGYRLVGKPFHLPGCGTPFWPMWRPPAKRPTTVAAHTEAQASVVREHR